jgi:hypothetical protein
VGALGGDGVAQAPGLALEDRPHRAAAKVEGLLLLGGEAVGLQARLVMAPDPVLGDEQRVECADRQVEPSDREAEAVAELDEAEHQVLHAPQVGGGGQAPAEQAGAGVGLHGDSKGGR